MEVYDSVARGHHMVISFLCCHGLPYSDHKEIIRPSDHDMLVNIMN